MKALVFLTLFFALFNNAYACPELQDTDLADGDGPWNFEVLETSPITLTQEEFFTIPAFSETAQWNANYFKECKDALVMKTLRSRETQRIFQAIITIEDHCDGGNSIGALFSQNLMLQLGSIGDSFISCK